MTTLLVLTALFLVLASVLAFKKPTNNANWQDPYSILPSITLSGDSVEIRNIRDFRYDESQNISEKRYIGKQYLFSDLKDVWYGISHFGANGLAHVFLSFEFANNNYLAVSIEARLKTDQAYGPIKGLLRNYTKTIVLGTENDVVGLRSHIRREPVYLYALAIAEETKISLLKNFFDAVNDLHTTPQFYNTLTDNCMTGLLDESGHPSLKRWIDYRILLPGYSDRLAYDLGLLDNTGSLENLQKRALVDASKTAIYDKDFSKKIRGL